jgi:hypothetical protein
MQAPRKLFCLLTIKLALSGCVYPGISLNKGHLLDPTMDPAKTGSLADLTVAEVHGRFERSAKNGGGSSDSACPTCR